MEEGLLFDGIALHASHVAPGHIQSAAAVIADLTDAGLAFRDGAAVPARVTADTVAIELFVELSFAYVLIDDIAQSGHSSLQGLF